MIATLAESDTLGEVHMFHFPSPIQGFSMGCTDNMQSSFYLQACSWKPSPGGPQPQPE